MADTCDKDTVETRIEEDRRFARRLRRIGFLALIVTATGVAIYAGVGRAGPQYRSGSGSRSEIVRSSVRNGPLTLFITSSSGYGASRIETVDPGKSKTIWHCPHNNFCGQPVSFAWAPDGRRVAFTLDEIGGTSPYPDLHVVDVVTKRDAQVSRATVGCFPAAEVDWSSDGARLAYSCGRINVLKLNGSGSATIPTPTTASWPSWSPAGNRIAYSTAVRPKAQSLILTVALDGSHVQLVAIGGAAPSWSPNGRTIAYQARCGIRLVTPSGRDVTPRRWANSCGAIGLSGGPPMWSPNGKKIALETKTGIFVMNANGSRLHLLASTFEEDTTTWYGALPGRPAWQPMHNY
jgi:Tol biopolymer transport system component